MEQSINHQELDSALKRCGATWGAGQVHGLLCSRLAVQGTDGCLRSIDQVLEGSDTSDAQRSECEAMLDALCSCTHRQLSERQSEFQPLLPDDSDSTIIRAEALARWCEGFLHGLVTGTPDEKLRQRLASEPLCDIIRDMLQITRATVENDSDDETNESAYAELVEYLRVAVQLAYEELAEFRPRQNEDAALH